MTDSDSGYRSAAQRGQPIWLWLCLGAVIIAVLVTVDWRFWQRYVTISGTPLIERHAGLYTPRFELTGTPRPLSFTAPGQETVSVEALDAAAAYAEAMGSHGLIVWHDGVVQLERYWLGRDAASMATTYSMHKTVVALLIGIAVDEGHIKSIDEPASTYFTEWQADARKDITIRQLLIMTGGLENFRLNDDPFDKALRFNYGRDRVAGTLAYPAESAPGSEFQYNGIETQALAIVLERATGMKYGEYLQQKLWTPVGNGPGFLWEDRPGGLVLATLGLYGSHRDWLRIGEILLDGGRLGGTQVVPKDWIAAMTTPSPLNPNYGFQTWIGSPYVAERSYSRNAGVTTKSSEPYLADDVFFADGFGAQRLYVIPAARVLIVRSGDPRMDWDDSRLPNLILKGLPPARKGD